ncbi:MAG TPA: hypothetical protein VIR57_05745 [Chloroflexota bacterium]
MLAPTGVLVLALLPRLWQIDLTRFFNDQVELLQSAAQWLDTGQLPLTSGFTFAVTGARHPPLVTYLLALPMSMNRNPVWVSGWVAVLDALAAPIVYLIAKRISGSTFAGVAAGALYAVNATAITSGRMIWNPDLGTFFAALTLLGLVDFAVRGRSLSLAVSLFALSWDVQLHVVNAVLAPLWVIVAIVGRKKVGLRPAAAAGLLSLVPLAPYLYLQMQTGWSDVTKLAGYLGLHKVADLAVLDTAAHLAGPAMYRSLIPGPDVPNSFAYDPLSWLLIGLLILGLALTWRRRASGRTVVAAWFAIPILAAVRHSSDVLSPADGVAAHYLLAILPAIAVLQAVALHDLWTFAGKLAVRCFPKVERLGLTVGAAALLAALLTPLVAGYLSFQRAAGTNIRQVAYGLPLRYSLAAADAVRSDAANQELYLAVPFLYNKTVPALAGRPDYRWYLDQSVFVFPNARASYLAQNDTFGYRFLSQHFGPAATTVRNDAGEPELGLFQLPEHAEAQVFSGSSYVPLNLNVDNAIQVQGYLAEPLAAGQPSRVSLLWRILDPARLPNHLSQFLHLVDQQGTMVSTAPDLWDVGEPWRAGDFVASGFDLNVKPEAPTAGYWLELGFYDTFSQQRLPMVGDATPAGTAIRIGPLRVAGASQGASSEAPLATLGNGEIGLLRAGWQGQDVTVDWEAVRKPQASYTVFVHAVDGAGKLVRQWDGLPRGGSYPTALWHAGDVVHDVYPIGVQPDSSLRLQIGMYTQPDVGRIQVKLPGRSAPADHFTLAVSDAASAP